MLIYVLRDGGFREIKLTTEAVPRVGETLTFDKVDYRVYEVVHDVDFLSTNNQKNYDEGKNQIAVKVSAII